MIDQIRRREWRQAEEESNPFIKGQRFNLFRNPENLTPKRESNLKGLLSYCQHRITSAKIEAFNGVIKRIIYKACGYNDLDYLYLKIRQGALK